MYTNNSLFGFPIFLKFLSLFCLNSDLEEWLYVDRRQPIFIKGFFLKTFADLVLFNVLCCRELSYFEKEKVKKDCRGATSEEMIDMLISEMNTSRALQADLHQAMEDKKYLYDWQFVFSPGFDDVRLVSSERTVTKILEKTRGVVHKKKDGTPNRDDSTEQLASDMATYDPIGVLFSLFLLATCLRNFGRLATPLKCAMNTHHKPNTNETCYSTLVQRQALCNVCCSARWRRMCHGWFVDD